MLKLWSLFAIVFFCVSMSAQAERFDIVEFAPPQGWAREAEANGVSFTKGDAQAYCAMTVLKSVLAGNDSKQNFKAVWDVIAQDYVKSVGALEMQSPVSENGWTVESGVSTATTDQGQAALMVVVATGGGKAVSLIILTNTQAYQKEIDAFVSSLKLPQVEVASQPATTNPANTGPSAELPGLWVRYIIETSGTVNGMPTPSGGYFRREYLFRPDGTYRFRAKDWSVIAKDILYVQETGKWSVNGNTLTLSPTQGNGGWWGKSADGRTVGWGARQKASDFKLEKTSYTYDLRYLSGMGETYLYLTSRGPTAREGRQSNSDTAQHEFSYSRRDPSKSLIDTPPGAK